MSRGNERYRHSTADANTITPVVGFRGNCLVKISHYDVVAQRCDYAGDARLLSATKYGRQDDHSGRAIPLRKRNAWIVDPLWPD